MPWARSTKAACPVASRICVFSFHPVKHPRDGRRRMVTTDRTDSLKRCGRSVIMDLKRCAASGRCRVSGTRDVVLGFNYRLRTSPVLSAFPVEKARANSPEARIAARYSAAFRDIPGIVVPPCARTGAGMASVPIRLDLAKLKVERGEFLPCATRRDIGRERALHSGASSPVLPDQFGLSGGEYPVAEGAYERLISLPMFHG